MSPEIASLTDTIERELGLLRELAGDLIACRAAFTGMDLDAIYVHIAKQAMLCQKLQKAEEERIKAWQEGAAHAGNLTPGGDLRAWIQSLDPPVALRLRALLTELVVAEGEVRNLNRVHTLLIDGSRKTLNVLTNALASFSPTYTAPAASKPISNLGAQR
jgi:hypothetical protein